MPTVYPIVPGHEIVGRVTNVGSAVTKLQARRSRRGRLHGRLRPHLPKLQSGPRAFCPNLTLTFNSPDKHTRRRDLRRLLRQHRRRRTLRPARPRKPRSRRRRAAPVRGDHHVLADAPLGRHKGKKVGVVGLGGLGHMGVKFAHAFGAHVVVFTTSPNKKEDALRLGADEVVVSRNADEMKKHAGSFDFILDTVSADHDINAYLNLLAVDGNLTLVGAPAEAARCRRRLV